MLIGVKSVLISQNRTLCSRWIKVISRCYAVGVTSWHIVSLGIIAAERMEAMATTNAACIHTWMRKCFCYRLISTINDTLYAWAPHIFIMPHSNCTTDKMKQFCMPLIIQHFDSVPMPLKINFSLIEFHFHAHCLHKSIMKTFENNAISIWMRWNKNKKFNWLRMFASKIQWFSSFPPAVREMYVTVWQCEIIYAINMRTHQPDRNPTECWNWKSVVWLRH